MSPRHERGSTAATTGATRTGAATTATGRRSGGPVAAAVGVVGELMITLGVLLGLFVVWQLWWTDVVAEREQVVLLEELSPPDVPAPSAEPPAVAPTTLQRRDAAPVTAEPATAETFGTLLVPRWGTDYQRTISQGTSRSQVLDELGIGHYEGTAMPGAVGNFALAGHRTTYGKPFAAVEELVVGDPLVVWVAESDTWFVYRVTDTEIVSPSQVDVIAPVPGDPAAVPTEARMTLTTCHPMYSARERFIVHSTLDYWMPVADGTPVELTGGA